MKLHSDIITWNNVDEALARAKESGAVTPDVHFVENVEAGSRSRRNGFEIQLGTYDKTSGPTTSRRYKNSGTAGADSVYAATWDEWGWFIREIFELDADAVFGPYKGRDDFRAKTNNKFI